MVAVEGKEGLWRALGCGMRQERMRNRRACRGRGAACVGGVLRTDALWELNGEAHPGEPVHP